eukprot:CAMPEP_0116895738 /NCGR_PEP_ID=MMETSP0467-20121206/5179_1 /TAXON_ID=283647 /ORGANISM="Mesodinium pulex, Strain SPMC105" /LENGTH=52 /DNA_ID=CAMNT_0004566603 /DNA_START=870 /DNA_END=1028 /DNA_ORIENTATION=-
MALSDNVIRGGCTAKLVDKDLLLSLAEFKECEIMSKKKIEEKEEKEKEDNNI